MEILCAYRDQVPVLSIVEACMKRKNEVASAKLSERKLLVKDRAASDLSAGLAVLVDSFESIQV